MSFKSNIPSLDNFLKTKPLFYSVIDLKRMPIAFEYLNKNLKLDLGNIIHIVGTNGKGSTGRFIAGYLHSKKISVAHYSSPHIFNFNERIWIDGKDISDELLEKYHISLYSLLDKSILNSLSYFEYTTLLFLLICHFLEIKIIVLEAGLGGEFDATNVVSKYLSLITCIDYDHKEFLGDKIEQISKTKLNSINNTAFISKQQHKIIYDIALEISKTKQINIKKCEDFLNTNKSYDEKKLLNILATNNIPTFQIENIKLALSALIYVKQDYNLQDINYNLLISQKMPFRCQKIKNNIWIDVGHNELSASAILDYFTKKNKKFCLIYNSLSNKNYKQILAILKPIIDKILYIEINDERMISMKEISNCMREFDISVDVLKSIDTNTNYLVFGSFLVVESFIGKHIFNV